MALKDLLTKQDFQAAYLQQYPLHEEFSYGTGPVIASGLKGDPGSGIADFKTTPFGKDQPKGGNSKQPYITIPIPEGVDNYAFKPIGNLEIGGEGSGILETINTVTSGLIRGGVITAGIHSATDVLRLAKFGIDLKRGIPFIAKQIGLQLSNVKMEAPSKSAPLLNNNRLYNAGVNTIAQAGVNAFGIHFRRHGIIPGPSKGQEDKTGYYWLVTRNNREDEENIKNLGNRLNFLLARFTRQGKGAPAEGSSQTRKPLYSYLGGPKSVYGIGKTTIRSYTNTLDQSKFFKLDEEEGTPQLYNYLSLDQPTSQEQRILPGSKQTISLNTLKDFRKIKGESNGGTPLGIHYQKISSRYGRKNMETRLGIGTGYDKLNMIPIIRAKSKEDKVNSKTKDLIRFFIEAVNNDNPMESDYIFFRAFIDSFGDTYKAKWRSHNFVGNPEPFFNYDSFDRDISLSFQVIVFRQEEQRTLYTKINALISQLMPDYKKNNTRARAPYIKLTVGDYLNRVPGFITSLKVKPLKGTTWEINLHDDSTIQSLPHALDITMAFQPIHNFVPQKVTKENKDVPFITLNSRLGDGIDDRQYIIGKGKNYHMSQHEWDKELADIQDDELAIERMIEEEEMEEMSKEEENELFRVAHGLDEEAERAEEISLSSQFPGGFEVETDSGIFGTPVTGI